ncbi:MAG: hypothetical protein HN919_20635 [Verrucomicrobia bacterium]|jgi:hypothetical protein|nr:hypothetical protein [Verrucomicrobiota bacterium]MBT7068713.1 hypothetical protein [Verrucomicrobiota bacterium]MBT7700997.1 hypothetical protein [Verrucomicrobiota bacterium]
MTTAVHSDVRMLRTQVLLILAGCVVAIGLLWALVLQPMRDEERACRHEVQDLERELGVFQVRMEDGDLAGRLSSAASRNRQLVAEWARLRETVDTFRDRDAIREALPTYEDGRIDFKVALFDAREQLVERAAKAGVSLPEDLGIPETIGTEERAELRLWQLAATVRLVQLAIDARLPAISVIESETPVAFSLDDDAAQMAMEFPTRMVLRCSFRHLVRFLDNLSREGSFYALRRLRVERLGEPGAEMLEADIVAGAFLFHLNSGLAEPGSEREPDVPGVRVPRTVRVRRARLAHTRREAPYDG